jgi:hypothetical protein
MKLQLVHSTDTSHVLVAERDAARERAEKLRELFTRYDALSRELNNVHIEIERLTDRR